MVGNIKILHINIYSFSLFFQNYEYEIENNWYIRIARHIKKIYPRIDIECLTPEIKYKNPVTINKNELKIRCFPSLLIFKKNKELSIYLINYIKKISENKNIILHIHGLKSYLTYLLPIIFKKVPIAIQDHGQSPPRSLNRKLIERIAFKNVDKFFILTERYENYLRKFISPDKILFQPMGVDLNIFKPIDKREARKILKINDDEKIILYVGALTTKKNVSLIVKSLPEILKLSSKIKLLIIGSGPEKENIMKLAERVGVVNNIKFCGYIENENLPLYYSCADLFILPSLYEGFGVVKIEALACNCPVLISDSIENRDIIKEGKNGLIFKSNNEKDLSEKIIYFFKNQQKFQGEHRKDIEKFSWENIAKNTIKIYNELSLKYYKERIF
jgi:glycosyltransferase involved in cell wall biosynthesis